MKNVARHRIARRVRLLPGVLCTAVVFLNRVVLPARIKAFVQGFSTAKGQGRHVAASASKAGDFTVWAAPSRGTTKKRWVKRRFGEPANQDPGLKKRIWSKKIRTGLDALISEVSDVEADALLGELMHDRKRLGRLDLHQDLVRLDYLASKGDVAAADKVFRAVYDQGASEERVFWNTLLKAAAKSGNVTYAKQMSQEMQERGISMNLKHTGKLTEAAGRAGDLDLAEYFFFQVCNKTQDFAPHMVHVSMLMKFSCKAGDLLRARRWMKVLGRHAEFDDFNELLSAYVAAGQAVEAEGLVLELVNGQRDDVLSPELFSKVISAFADIGDASAAKRWYGTACKRFQKMSTKVRNGLALIVLQAYATAGDVKGAEAWMEEATPRGAPGHGQQILVQAAANAGDLCQAERLMGTILENPVISKARKTAIFKFIIKAAGDLGHPERAIHWFRVANSSGAVDAIMYDTVIAVCAWYADLAGAEQIVSEMLQSNIVPTTHTFSAVIRACSRAHQPERAFAWREKFREMGLKEDEMVMNLLIGACSTVRPKLRESAEQVFQEMVDMGLQVNGTTLNALCLAIGPKRTTELAGGCSTNSQNAAT